MIEKYQIILASINLEGKREKERKNEFREGKEEGTE